MDVFFVLMLQTHPLRGTREHHRDLLSSWHCCYAYDSSGTPPPSLVTSSLFCFGKQEAPLPQHGERLSLAVGQSSVSSLRVICSNVRFGFIKTLRLQDTYIYCLPACRLTCRQVWVCHFRPLHRESRTRAGIA